MTLEHSSVPELAALIWEILRRYQGRDGRNGRLPCKLLSSMDGLMICYGKEAVHAIEMHRVNTRGHWADLLEFHR